MFEGKFGVFGEVHLNGNLLSALITLVQATAGCDAWGGVVLWRKPLHRLRLPCVGAGPGLGGSGTLFFSLMGTGAM